MIILGWYRRYYRIIRVGAGNSALHLKYMYLKPVYPHWRGELVSLPGISITGSGLPPLARGTRGIPGASSQRKRFTPAGAGNSGHSWCVLAKKTVYPRWRGELLPRWLCRSLWNGLPPLARGTLALFLSGESRYRFTPAGAGNSRYLVISSLSAAVYPRWRGELRNRSASKMIAAGLPPLARGTPRVARIHLPPQRFTPAGAGNSGLLGSIISAVSVYPRWRGELGSILSFNFLRIGLPPLARGTL